MPVIEADAVAHDVIGRWNGRGRRRSPRGSAPRSMTADGAVDRRRLGAPSCSEDAGARRDLEAIVHPAVYAAIDAWMAERAGRGEPLAVAEIPLLYETGHDGDFDRVVVTACDRDEQVRRIVARGGTEADARRRIAAQWPLAERSRRPTSWCRTDGTLDDTRAERADAALELRLAAAAR